MYYIGEFPRKEKHAPDLTNTIGTRVIELNKNEHLQAFNLTSPGSFQTKMSSMQQKLREQSTIPL